mmetsp:Transcript_18300/g.57939  ORF Transcript_18300/g.57939 Transcript_18300/m.57939 type:complete len:257 (+) Transcript_18300:1766-2536(+)
MLPKMVSSAASSARAWPVPAACPVARSFTSTAMAETEQTSTTTCRSSAGSGSGARSGHSHRCGAWAPPPCGRFGSSVPTPHGWPRTSTSASSSGLAKSTSSNRSDSSSMSESGATRTVRCWNESTPTIWWKRQSTTIVGSSASAARRRDRSPGRVAAAVGASTTGREARCSWLSTCTWPTSSRASMTGWSAEAKSCLKRRCNLCSASWSSSCGTPLTSETWSRSTAQTTSIFTMNRGCEPLLACSRMSGSGSGGAR